jgi:hypothetical protein
MVCLRSTNRLELGSTRSFTNGDFGWRRRILRGGCLAVDDSWTLGLGHLFLLVVFTRPFDEPDGGTAAVQVVKKSQLLEICLSRLKCGRHW